MTRWKGMQMQHLQQVGIGPSNTVLVDGKPLTEEEFDQVVDFFRSALKVTDSVEESLNTVEAKYGIMVAFMVAGYVLGAPEELWEGSDLETVYLTVGMRPDGGIYVIATNPRHNPVCVLAPVDGEYTVEGSRTGDSTTYQDRHAAWSGVLRVIQDDILSREGT